MKVVVIATMWKRPEIFKIFADRLKKAIKASDHTGEVVMVGSEGEVSKTLAEAEGFHYVEASNDNRPRKINAAAQYAKTLEPDYVMALGSDDLINSAYLNQLTGADFIGSLGCLFYDTPTGKMVGWVGYSGDRLGEPIGAGRAFSSRLMDKLGWKPWDDEHLKSPDFYSWILIKKQARSMNLFKIGANDTFLCDLKSEDSISSFDKLRKAPDSKPLTTTYSRTLLKETLTQTELRNLNKLLTDKLKK